MTIEKLAGLGDGAGTHAGRKTFVPYTLPGDVVEARVVRVTADADYASLIKIITPGVSRIAPVCRHFGACGGCSLQHLRDAEYADFKWQTARAAVRKAGYSEDTVQPLLRFPAASRRRAELKVEAGRLGYYAANSHSLVAIDECKVLEPELEALLLAMKPDLALLPGLTGIQVNGVDDGYDLVLFARRFGEVALPRREGVKRLSLSDDAGLRTLFASGPVTVTLGDVRVAVPPGAFLQASRAAQAQMTQRVVDAVHDASPVLDLFAGIGAYGFRLPADTHVTAVEGDKAMVAAMREAAQAHGRTHFTAERRDLFRDPLPPAKLRRFEAVILNPPRTGAKAQCEQLAQMRIPRVVMVSCNPATFARDARTLREGGYELRSVTPIDQFVYSPHLELIAEFAA